MAGYFSYFPSILYGNTAVTNVIAKIRFDQSVAQNLAVFYPYTIEQGERADQIANFYYGSPQYDWVVYLSNGIVDPYHDWYMSEDQFNFFLKTKYGTIANTQEQTAFYRVNYFLDDTFLTTAAYDALSKGQKKYWVPQLGYTEEIIGYVRKNLDLSVETNKTIQLDGSFSNISSNSIIKQSSTVTGTVGFANSSMITLKHITGSWQANTAIYGQNNNLLTNNTITAVTTINEPIPSDELAYWTPVSVFDRESEINERKKHIKLLNNSYLTAIENDMKELLSL
jgi:hypothetical protein